MSQLGWRDRLSYCCEIGIHHGVRISLTTLTDESTMVETSKFEHLPDQRISPEVRHWLWNDLDCKVIVMGLHLLGWCESMLYPQTHQIVPKRFECIVIRWLIVLSFSLAKTNQSIAIADEQKHTTMVNSIQTCHIGHAVTIDEDELKLTWIESIVPAWLKITIWPCACILLLPCLLFLGVCLFVSVIHMVSWGVFVDLPVHLEEVFHVFPPAEFLKHDHLVAAELGRLGK